MTKIFCDKCGEEISTLIIISITVLDGEYPTSDLSTKLDFCYSCGKAFEKEYNIKVPK